MNCTTMLRATVLAVLVLTSSVNAAQSHGPSACWVYIGTYTGGDSEGIYLLRLDAETGHIENLGLAGAVENPSFLALHPEEPFLYSVGNGTDAAGERKGLASAFTIHPDTGMLTLQNQESAVGDGPCHVTVDRAGRHILVANYGSGSVAVLQISQDGNLGEATTHIQHEGASVHPSRQQRPYAHAVNMDESGRYAYVSDLGIDKIMIYRYDHSLGTLTANEPPFVDLAPGAGPRHFAFNPVERYAYSVNELDNTVTAFRYEPETGALASFQTITTLPAGFDGENTTAEIRVHPSGRFVYASNRGHDSIAMFAVDSETGRLTSRGQIPTQGKTPRNFNITPDGRFLLAANQATNNVVVFRIDQEIGLLKETGHLVEVPTPVCVLFAPAP